MCVCVCVTESDPKDDEDGAIGMWWLIGGFSATQSVARHLYDLLNFQGSHQYVHTHRHTHTHTHANAHPRHFLLLPCRRHPAITRRTDAELRVLRL